MFLEDYIVHYLGKGKLPVSDPWIALTASPPPERDDRSNGAGQNQ